MDSQKSLEENGYEGSGKTEEAIPIQEAPAGQDGLCSSPPILDWG